MKVYVLMSSYNGEKYISEQIDSVLLQTGVDINLFIRDDGSTDKTISIIEEKMNEDSRIHLMKGENIGVKYSFLILTQQVDVEADYYAFCDQDDYWLPEKLSKALEKLTPENNNLPLLYFSHTRLVDEKLNVLDVKNPYNISKPYNFGQLLIKNCASGCTMVFNNVLKQLVSKSDVMNLHKTPLHDHWIYLVCLATGGKVVMDTDSHILYRQHGNNAVGSKRTIWNQISESPLMHKGDHRLFWARDILDNYSDDLSEQNIAYIKMITNYKENMWTTIHLAFSGYIKPPKLIEKIVILFTVLFRRF